MSESVTVCWSDGGSVSGVFTQALLNLFEFERASPAPRYRVLTPARESGLYVQENRNRLVKSFLASDADWLFQLDGDESFRPELLRTLMRTADVEERPIVVGLYANVGQMGQVGAEGGVTIVNMVYSEVEDGQYAPLEPPKTLQPFQVHAAGAGVLLVHRSVFERVPEPWFWVEMFQSSEREEWQFMNEDIAFCRRVREAGFEIWCDPLAEVVHWKTLPLMPSTVRTYLRESERVLSEMRDGVLAS